MSGNKAFIVLAVTITASVLGAAPAGAGTERDHGRGRYLVPCSLDGVNPVDHPRIFGNPAFAKSYYGFVQGRDRTWHVEPNCRKPAFIGPGAE